MTASPTFLISQTSLIYTPIGVFAQLNLLIIVAVSGTHWVWSITCPINLVTFSQFPTSLVCYVSFLLCFKMIDSRISAILIGVRPEVMLIHLPVHHHPPLMMLLMLMHPLVVLNLGIIVDHVMDCCTMSTHV